MNLPSMLLAAALLMGVGPCATADEADEANLVSVQFLRVPGTEDDRTALLQLDGEQTLEVDLPNSALSPIYQLPKPETWVLGKSVRNAEGKDVFEAMGRAASTTSKHQVVVVIDKGAMNDGKIKLIAMDLDLKADTFQMVNASKFDISGELGIERFGIAPGEHALLKAEATSTDEYDRRFCQVAFSFLKDKEYVKFIDANWHIEDRTFALIIFHQEALADKLKMTVIREQTE